MVPVKPPGAQAGSGAAVGNAGLALVPAGLASQAWEAKAGVSAFNPSGLSNSPNPLSQLASSLGLPQDNLTFTLLTFARVFSLPLESMHIADLRKDILAFTPSSPKTDREKARAEVFSLASTAAASKGLKLGQEALAELAAAYSPEDDGKGQARHEEKGYPGEPQAQPPNPAELREAFDKFSESDGLLGLMNRIYKENGQNWVVWPFKMSVRGTELRVFVRILIEEPNPGSGLLMADITGPKRHWRFFLEKPHEGKFRARIGLSPGLEPGGLKALERDAAKALGSFLGIEPDLQVLNGEISLADFLGCEALPSINKEV
jgi:hypothetical protein